MKKVFYSCVLVVVIILLFNGCKKDVGTPPNGTAGGNIISGSAQKGPFANGTSITIFELDSTFSQTGKSFFTQIVDNSGSFQLKHAPLVSKYVQIRADGFYFNEICGSNSSSQITLNGIAKIADSTTPLHINLLTHLEKPRAEYLLTQGLPFDSAKSVAQSDVLGIFKISINNTLASEFLDISQSGDGNAALLAISCILQGHRTESELSSILALISNDIRTDGILDDSTTQSSLIDHALLLDTVAIRNNISNFYLGLNMNVSIPYFEKYVQQFIANTVFPVTNSVIYYPAKGFYGDNILDKSVVTYSVGNYSLAGQTKKCASLTIRIHTVSGAVYYISDAQNLNFSSYNFSSQEQFFWVINPVLPFDIRVMFNQPATYLIEYFEVNSSSPSFSKTITVN